MAHRTGKVPYKTLCHVLRQAKDVLLRAPRDEPTQDSLARVATILLQHMLSHTHYRRGYIHLPTVTFDSEIVYPHDVVTTTATTIAETTSSPARQRTIAKPLLAAVPPVQAVHDLLSSSGPVRDTPTTPSYCSATPFYDHTAYPHVLAESFAEAQQPDSADDKQAVLHFFHGFGRVWLGEPDDDHAQQWDHTLSIVHILTQGLEDLVYRVYHGNMVKFARTNFVLFARLARCLNQPATTILQSTQVMAESNGLTDAQYKAMKRVERAGFNIAEVVNDLSDMIVLQRNTVNLQYSPFDLRDCLQNAMQVMRHHAKRKQLRLLHTVDEAVPEMIMGDATRVEQVLVNLLSNAIRFTTRGSVQVSIVADTSPEAERLLAKYHRDRVEEACTTENVPSYQAQQQCRVVTVSVKDTGVGIPYAKLQRVFYAYRTLLDETNEGGDMDHGIGVGLAICRALVELMGGRMWVRSKMGEGSTFSFSFVTRAFIDMEKVKTQWRVHLDNKTLLLVCADEDVKEGIYNAFMFNTNARIVMYASVEKALAFLEHQSQPVHGAIIDVACAPSSDAVTTLVSKLQARDRTIPLIGIQRSVSGRHDDKTFSHVIPVPIDAYTVVNITHYAISETSAVVREDDENPLNVLVVLERAEDQKHMLDTLYGIGYRKHVDVVSDGYTALRKLQARAYDAILVQSRMSPLSGYNTIQKIQALPHAQDSYVIALLDPNTSPTSETRLKNSVLYLHLPIDASELHIMLTMVAERKLNGSTSSASASL